MVTMLMWMHWVGLRIAAGAEENALTTNKLFTLEAVVILCPLVDSRTQTTNLKVMANKKSSDVPGGNGRSIRLGLKTGGYSRPSC